MAHWALYFDLNIRISATSLIRKTLKARLIKQTSLGLAFDFQ